MDDLVVLILVSLFIAYIMLHRYRERYILYTGIQCHTTFQPGIFTNIHPPTPTIITSETRPPYIKSEKVDRALWRIVEYVIRDFVDWWFVPNVSTHDEMPNDVRDMLDHAFSTLGDTVSNVNWTYFVSQRVLTNLKELLRRLRRAERQLQREHSKFSKATSEVRIPLLRAEILRSFKLHCVAAGSTTPTDYLRNISACLCSQLLRERDYNSNVVRTLVREVLTCNILVPCLSFVHPYYINAGVVAAFKSVMTDGDGDATMSTTDGAVHNSNNNNNNHSAQVTEEDRGSSDELLRRDSLTMKMRAWDVEKQKRRNNTDHRKLRHKPIGVSTLSFAADELDEQVGSTNTQAPTKWSIQIVRPITKFDPKPFVVYHMKVENGTYSWSVEKRFSEFVEMHENLTHAVKGIDVQLPKKQVFGNLDTKFIQDRKRALQAYMEGLMSNRKVVEHELFRLFLMPSMDTPLVPVTRPSAQSVVSVPKFSSADLLQSSPSKQASHSRSRTMTTHMPSSTPSVRMMGGIDDDDASSVPLPPNNTPVVERHRSRRSKVKGVFKDIVRKLHRNAQARKASNESTTSSTTSMVMEEDSDNDDDDDDADENDDDALEGVEGERSVTKTPPTTNASSRHHVRRTSLSTPNSPREHRKSATSSVHVSPHILSAAASNLNDGFRLDDHKPPPVNNSSNNSNNREQSKSSTRRRQHARRASMWHENKLITQPLYGLIDEVFALEEKNIFSRQVSRIVVQMLEWLMDRTIRVWFSNQVKSYTNEETVVDIIDRVTDTVWPDGVLFKPGDWPPEEEMVSCAEEARKHMEKCIPRSLETLLGARSCEKASRRLYEFCQIEPLILHLAYSSLDALVLELFPQLQQNSTTLS